jgi:hypothetical protein
MTNRLEAAVNALYALDTSQTPVALGRAREAAIVEGLNALAENFGKKIDFTYIHSNGDLKFNIEGADRGIGEFGANLAAYLSKIPTRTGLQPSEGTVLPENNWLWINHFAAEKLLKIVGKEMFDIDPDNALSSGPRL